MGHVSVTCSKIKTTSGIAAAYVHNTRKGYCDNVDKSRSKDNVVIIDRGKDYLDSAKKRLNELKEFRKEKGYPAVRKDAVLALEVVIGVGEKESRENPLFDQTKFAEVSKDWINKTFGEENVMGAVMHLDEHGPHIHAVVIPVNESGLLCAKHYMNMNALSGMQTSIAYAMQDMGLSRGQKRSKAKHDDIQKFYADLKESSDIKIPDREKGEDIDIYAKRVQRNAERIVHQFFAKNAELKNELGRSQGKVLELEDRIKQLEKDLADAKIGGRQLDQIGELLDGNYLSPKEDAELRSTLAKAYDIIQKNNITGENYVSKSDNSVEQIGGK